MSDTPARIPCERRERVRRRGIRGPKVTAKVTGAVDADTLALAQALLTLAA